MPIEIIEYVENSRNPDIYLREFVEVVMKNNQLLKGRSEALLNFRDILAQQIVPAIPEMKEDVRSVVEASGGHIEGP